MLPSCLVLLFAHSPVTPLLDSSCGLRGCTQERGGHYTQGISVAVRVAVCITASFPVGVGIDPLSFRPSAPAKSNSATEKELSGTATVALASSVTLWQSQSSDPAHGHRCHHTAADIVADDPAWTSGIRASAGAKTFKAFPGRHRRAIGGKENKGRL